MKATRIHLAVFCLYSAWFGTAQARHYILIRRVYAGEEGQAMLERDENSRMMGWPVGVSSEVALMDSAPILRAVVQKDEESNEVVHSNSEVSRAPGFFRDRGAPRRVEESSESSTETNQEKIASGSEDQVKIKETVKDPTKIDIHNHEPEMAESHGTNSTQAESSQETLQTNASSETPKSSDDDEPESIDIADIEKIMSKHKIRIMGAAHPMANLHLDQERAESISQSSEQRPRDSHNHDLKREDAHQNKKVPDQVMRIAEWLLNRGP